MLSDISFDVCVCLSGDMYRGDTPTDQGKSLHDGTSVLRTGVLARSLDLTANISKMVSRSLTRQNELNISSTRAF